MARRPFLNHFLRMLSLALLPGLVTALPAPAQTTITAENLRDHHVGSAIRAIVDELYSRKLADKHWEPSPYPGATTAGQAGGYTALVALALIYAGETYQDERLAEAIEYLEKLDMGGTYAVAVRCNLWALLPPRFESQLDKDRRWLLSGFSDRAGGWNYQQEPATTRRDNSITQYGTLALWEAAKRGQRIEKRYWQLLEDRFLAMQLGDGGWNYTGTGGATGSMTTAGLTVLFITQDFLHAHEAVKLAAGSTSANQAAIDRGLAWMEHNFSVTENPGRETDYFYYMYGVERVGLASGYKYFRNMDWYRAGAAALINKLCSWDPESGEMKVHERLDGNARAGEIRTVDLAFSLMFLSRGRVPVSINKLSLKDAAWNNRPRDVANLTHRISARTETGLNWQIVSADADAEEWLDAQMLYLASNAAPGWLPADQQEREQFLGLHRQYRDAVARGDVPDASPLDTAPMLRKLKRYLDLGGLLFANAEGRSRAFAEEFEAIGTTLYPHLSWRDLEPDHAAYTLYQPVTGARPPLRGLSNGVRELIILSPTIDFSEGLQSQAPAADARFDTAMNLFLYASEMNRGRPRVQPHVLEEDDDALRAGGISARIVRASHAGAWDAEPAALEVFSAWAWKERGLNIEVDTSPLAAIATLAPKPTLVWVSGIDAVELSQAERDAIQAYTQGGGVILFETAGGRGAFTSAVETQLREQLQQPIRALMRHAVVSGADVPGTEPISRVEYRAFSRDIFGARETAPRLRGIVSDDGSARVLFSREDISQALLDQPRWGVSGYTPQWARQVAANIVQYAASQR
ncbi:MAG: DUF4159 domain-containing protein [Phycisphaerales bacterium]